MRWRVILTLMFAFWAVCQSTANAQKDSGPSDRDFEDAFMLFEKAELIDDVIKEGDKFNLDKELRDLQQKYARTFGREMPERLILDFDGGVRNVWAMPPEARPPRLKNLPPSPDLFLAEERVRVLSRTRRDGDKFDPAAELDKIAARFESKFGAPMPGNLRDRYLQDVQVARAIVPRDAGETRDTAKTDANDKLKQPVPTAASKALKQIRSLYLDGIPDWFRQRDANQDGQLGLYEWPRTQIDEFSRYDLNRDGFVVQTEVVRALGLTIKTPTAPSKTTDTRRTDRR